MDEQSMRNYDYQHEALYSEAEMDVMKVKLKEAKAFIKTFVWPPDMSEKQHQEFAIKAAKFAGCTIPVFTDGLKSESM